MAIGKEIRGKIKSVQNTQKITRAMQMVATSKMRKTQERMRASRPYAENIRRVMSNLASINKAAKNMTPFLRSSDKISRVGVILITSDKGLCGSLNSNAIKLFYNKLSDWQKNECAVHVCALGYKALTAITRVGIDPIASAVSLGDIPQLDKLIGPLSALLNKFHNNELDAVYVIYSQFINTMKQLTVCEQLLPLREKDLQVDLQRSLQVNSSQNSSVSQKMPWDYVYEPSNVEELLDELIRRYLESVVFQCLADNMASEQASRMIAMRAATDNAGEAINQLRLIYNKSRQATITKELSEIVAGSAAV